MNHILAGRQMLDVKLALYFNSLHTSLQSYAYWFGAAYQKDISPCDVSLL